MGEAVIISPTIIVVISLVGGDEPFQYLFEIPNQTRLVLDGRKPGCRAGDKKRGETASNFLGSDLLLDLCGDINDVAEALSLLG